MSCTASEPPPFQPQRQPQPRDTIFEPCPDEGLHLLSSLEYDWLCGVLRLKPGLKVLQLNNQKPEDAGILARALVDCGCEIRELEIQCWRDVPEVYLDPVLDAVAPYVEVLVLNRACIPGNGLLWDNLTNMPKLHTLRMDNMYFDEKTTAHLCEALKLSQALRVLEFNRGFLDAQTAQVVKACRALPHLQRLTLNDWIVGDIAGAELVTLIEATRSIKHFVFQYHRMSRYTMDRMYTAFAANPAVTECLLEYGRTGHAGFEVLNDDRRARDALPSDE